MEARAERALPGVVAVFAPGASLAAAGRLGRGHINDTFLVELAGAGAPGRLVLQRLNRRVFPDPGAVMANLERVLDHLHRRLADLDPGARARRVLTLVRTADGAAFARDAGGDVWRATEFIGGAHPCTGAGGPAEAGRAAAAFGEFLRLLGDYDGPPLVETIPGFHDTRRRVTVLHEAVARDAAGRAAGCRAEIDLALAREGLASVLPALREAGLVRERVTHNDTKLDNVLVDDATGAALAVLDLDTVMPGLVLADFGDMVRSGVSGGREDDPDPARQEVDPALFEALVRGFVAGIGEELSPPEVDHLAAAGRVITYETGVRFLTDHLDGDAYFSVQRDGHNLDRARAQFARLASLERRDAELRRVAAQAARDARVIR